MLVLYGRTYCHLCDEMLQHLEQLQGEMGFSLRVVDVDENADLEARFGERVPVLMAGEREICHYRLDQQALRTYLSEH